MKLKFKNIEFNKMWIKFKNSVCEKAKIIKNKIKKIEKKKIMLIIKILLFIIPIFPIVILIINNVK